VTYSVRAFAELAGVTIKTLHHYERRGLLAPRRSRAGYRRYTIKDLARLERIIALKSLGLPLKEIARLKGSRSTGRERDSRPSGAPTGEERQPSAPGATEREPFRRAFSELATHRDKLIEKHRLLGEAIAAIDAVARAGDPRDALERFVGESSWNRWKARRAELASPAPRAPDRASPSRFALFHEIREALDRDPSGASAKPLVARWDALLEAEADGNPQTIAAMRKISATRAKWPDGARRWVASLYDTDVDTWERIASFLEKTPSQDPGI
jgi:DNA-binding transcriptional MerR regulator